MAAYSNLIVQAVVTALVVVAATVVTLLPAEPVISGDALVGLYAAVLGYVFGATPGITATAVAERTLDRAERVANGEARRH